LTFVVLALELFALSAHSGPHDCRRLTLADLLMLTGYRPRAFTRCRQPYHIGS
jgi:hypothetical protein